MTRGWRTTRAALAGLLAGLAVAVVAYGRPGVVTTKQGDIFRGDVTERGNAVVIKRGTEAPVTLNKANISNIEYSASAAEGFNDRLAKLGPKDVKGRMALVREAVDQQEYDVALDLLDGVVAIDPNNEEALQMQRAVRKQRQIARQGGAASTPAAGGAGKAATPAASGSAAANDRATTRRSGGKLRTVTAEEVNRIRQMELQKGERVTVRFENDVKRAYQGSSGFTPQQFNAMSPPEQAFEIITNGSSKMRKDVTIATDPASLAQFKSAVQRNILPGCAASACHSAPGKAGDFFLHNPAARDIETYTNFILLQNYETSIDGREGKLIDRTRPEDSLLLQFGLPLQSANVPHPKVQNFRPIFKGKTDPKYVQVVEWLGRTLAPIAPEYGIDLTEEPAGDSTTRPAAAGERTRDRDMRR